ncbi:hypothetical protein CEXT_810661 [Caerostris extrusa]|uniref:Uncharacterized protein n=1 Tax=Caerostris extrusa TaxID=172846 RepID=A0AAV4QKE0_CAEEX|nr:hypothetical protein CEXT_810661 [Caerostris extrusa]
MDLFFTLLRKPTSWKLGSLFLFLTQIHFTFLVYLNFYFRQMHPARRELRVKRKKKKGYPSSRGPGQGVERCRGASSRARVRTGGPPRRARLGPRVWDCCVRRNGL